MHRRVPFESKLYGDKYNNKIFVIFFFFDNLIVGRRTIWAVDMRWKIKLSLNQTQLQSQGLFEKKIKKKNPAHVANESYLGSIEACSAFSSVR